MARHHTFSVLPIVRQIKMNANGEVPIYIRITVDGEIKEISTKQWVDAKLWSSEKGKVKGNKEKARVINMSIDRIKTKLDKIHHDLERNDELITAGLIKDLYIGKN